MDKRTLLFVLAMTLTLFAVNIFFEQRNISSNKEWNAQQAAKKTEKLKVFTEEMSKKTAAPSALPLATLYADSAAQEPITQAVQSGKAYLALQTTQEMPKTVYVKNQGKTINLMLLPKQPTSLSHEDEPVIYAAEKNAKLEVGILPEFGKYDLQLIVPSDDGQTPDVYLVEYTDGHLDIVAEKVANLQRELDHEKPIKKPNFTDAIVVLKGDKEYLPVAIYRSNERAIQPLTAYPALADSIEKSASKDKLVTTNQKTSEKFYVLETPYQQLVFSNYGGALVEINLPFKSKEDKESVVKEIEADREMAEKHPYNAHFPSHAYYTPGNNPKHGFTEHSKGEVGGYYPLVRRDLIENDTRKNVKVPPKYYALNIVSEYPETAELVYDVKSFDKDSIVFETVQGHRRITKTFSVASEAQAPYCIDLTVNINGDSRGLWLTSGIPEVEWISGSPAPALKYRLTRNKKSDVETIDLPKDSITVTSTPVDWVCNSNGFLGMILDPLSENDPGYRAVMVPGNVVPSRLVEIDQQYDRYKAIDMPGYMVLLPLKNAGGTMHFRVFAGPFSTNILEGVDKAYSNTATGYNPDYIACQSFHGWFSFISEPFAKFLFILMNFFHSITGSWAFSIILLTVALRIMLWPLNAWSTKSMVRMQQIAPEVTAIQEKYKKDPKKVQLEIMNLYRERGVNPVSGCFPLLIQMPFLIGMFDLLKSTFELRGASFIPGWIDNLTAPDVLFSWSYPIFFIGNQFHLLPILLGLVMFLQQRLMTTMPEDKTTWTEQQRQQRAMGNIMTVVFTIMFYNFPSGLNIYWLSSMLLGILQQYWTTKHLKTMVSKTQLAVVKGKK